MMKNKKLISIIILTIFAFALSAATDAKAQNLKYICPDINAGPCVQAKKMIAASQLIALGEEPKGNNWTYTAEGMLSGPCSDKSYEQKIRDGLKLSDATNYWKCYLASPFSGDGTGYQVIKRASLKVYGTTATVGQNKQWMEQIKQKKAWYAPIVFAEQGNLYKNTEQHKKVIDSIYRKTMNRGATQTETDYWLGNKSDFEQMYVAARKWLYSPAGATDLHDTVKRAYWVLNQKYPTEDEIKTWTEKFKPGKKIYLEMIGKETGYDF